VQKAQEPFSTRCFALAQGLDSISRRDPIASDRARGAPFALRAWSPRTSPGGECRVLSPRPCAALSCLNRTARRCVTRLDGRTRHGAVGAEHAAVTRLGTQQRAAAGAFIKILASVGWHRLRLRRTAARAGDGGIRYHSDFSLNARACSRCRTRRSGTRRSSA